MRHFHYEANDMLYLHLKLDGVTKAPEELSKGPFAKSNFKDPIFVGSKNWIM